MIMLLMIEIWHELLMHLFTIDDKLPGIVPSEIMEE
jgi:hypothetical protein